MKPHRCKECSLLRVDKEDQTCEECMSYLPAVKTDSAAVSITIGPWYFVDVVTGYGKVVLKLV